ncbi:hypothetical protein PR202_ga29902 [Eleusine coracana subsp. coracana]|uniref:Uncharacterized protein n=1 Tax=Eleusine coracana subsp. coracana TaxID=191504 RepID=A0AAV5DMY2_ELECO|nr:hypothetical protein PR202_ga29902 [Eleusine coracana subsp. coracana]
MPPPSCRRGAPRPGGGRTADDPSSGESISPLSFPASYNAVLLSKAASPSPVPMPLHVPKVTTLKVIPRSKIRHCSLLEPLEDSEVSARAERPAAVAVAIDTLLAESGGPSRRRARRRCRLRARRGDGSSSLPSDSGEAPQAVSVVTAATPLPNPAGNPPLCIIDRSASITRVEADLCRALLITVVGNRPLVTANQVLEEVAAEFDVEQEAMAIIAAIPEDFLLVLSNVATTDRVYNNGLPLHGLGFSLHVKRWSWLALAQGATLPELINLELHGVPAHA